MSSVWYLETNKYACLQTMEEAESGPAPLPHPRLLAKYLQSELAGRARTRVPLFLPPPYVIAAHPSCPWDVTGA